MGVLPPGGSMGEAAAQAHARGGAIVTAMTTPLVNVMVTVVVDRGVVEAAGMTGMMMEAVEAADMRGMTMEGGAGMVAPHQGVVALQGTEGAQSGKAVRSAGPRLNSGTVNGRQSSDVPLQAS
jgi:hypothetical protein